MNANKLLYDINDIDDAYVIEYAERSEALKARLVRRRIRTWSTLAACLVLIVLCMPLMINMIQSARFRSQDVDTVIRFESFPELCKVLPEDSALLNIPDVRNAKISAKLYCPKGTKKIEDFETVKMIDLTVEYKKDVEVFFNCVFNEEIAAEEYVKESELSFFPESVKQTVISGTEVFFAEGTGPKAVKSFAAFNYKGDLYKLWSFKLDIEELIAYVTAFLK